MSPFHPRRECSTPQSAKRNRAREQPAANIRRSERSQTGSFLAPPSEPRTHQMFYHLIRSKNAIRANT